MACLMHSSTVTRVAVTRSRRFFSFLVLRSAVPCLRVRLCRRRLALSACSDRHRCGHNALNLRVADLWRYQLRFGVICGLHIYSEQANFSAT